MNDDQSSLKLIGEKIRYLRKKENISISEFANKTGVTASYISQIERNIIEPSLPVLRNLAKALNIEIPFLFGNDIPSDVLITSEDNRLDVAFVDGFAKFQFMMPSYLKNDAKPDMSVMISKIYGKLKDSNEFACHNYSEFCLVLDGCIEYHTDKEIYKLFKGDSIYIKRNVPHLLFNPDEEEAILLAVMSSVPSRFTIKD